MLCRGNNYKTMGSNMVDACSRWLKQPDNFDKILQAKTYSGKYLMEKCLLGYKKQLSFKYFVKLILIQNL